ncbi:MAG: 50S ribosomal protein L24 [Candidatus Omnitrophica bacterium CG23_combo_of_CG06-09_8_20_14_all_40_11]|nr:MAG: 50S ribosomal protein L24 [Candidatus Omnitrophica bacterium CG23_combo_of_CG06-09_8_20_14_all_40_11]
MFKIRKGDTVEIIKGKDRGKKGKVLKVFPLNGRAIVEGINLVKKHKRKTREDEKGGIVPIEMPISLTNLMLFCKNCNRGRRIGFTILKDGTKARFCKNCKEAV